jgi:hypothetical protein
VRSDGVTVTPEPPLVNAAPPSGGS